MAKFTIGIIKGEELMILRVKLVWRIVSVASVIGIVVMLVEKFSSGEFSTRDWITLIIWPFFSLMFLFIAPTSRITFGEQGISVYWKIGVGSFKLWELRDFSFRWDDVLHVYNLNPRWFPLQMIGIIALHGEKQHMFFIGSLMTHKKEALLYIADHVGRGIIDQEVRKMIEKYRRQLQD